MEFFRRILNRRFQPFEINEFGQPVHLYGEILNRALKATQIIKTKNKNIGLLANGSNYVAMLWGIWISGNSCIPLSPLHTNAEWTFFLEDSEVEFIIAEKQYNDKLRDLHDKKSLSVVNVETIDELTLIAEPDFILEDSSTALILYTSGTTGRPKGVMWSHANLQRQMKLMEEAWRWRETDIAVNILPLHHFHGIVNILLCCCWVGARILLLERYSTEFWQLCKTANVSVLMAVPTIYCKLISLYESLTAEEKIEFSNTFKQMRLTVSGSAALPSPIFSQWKNITGQNILERYGMTETGMVLTNPYNDDARLMGRVGLPFVPSSVNIIDETLDELQKAKIGQLVVKRGAIFSGYWKKEEETKKAFHGEWFLTGDLVAISLEEGPSKGTFQILGRLSQDIIKSGGYKISALEIESVILAHPQVEEAAVLGLEDQTWGQLVAAAVVSKKLASISTADVSTWCSTQLAHYKCPRKILMLESLPKNSLGKVSKTDIKKLFE